ncbi:adenosylcobinamide-phosphate synthase CbiB [Kushneria aurantia]|uniref:Cobalamin biosynthesis protein CobD n=1 Tax=Kushneria aurantia TaxID=504092 RepID=A0ABV6G4U9_9GAMM|nr:adenosylcobinamide-phosphate synthase CbiB [Kushneria aurantia]
MLVTTLTALFLDRLWGEPRRFHPLVWLGRWADRVEAVLYAEQAGKHQAIARGAFAWLGVTLPPVALAFMLDNRLSGLWHTLFAALMVYLAIGWRSLKEHAERVMAPLVQQDIAEARRQLSMMVSRDVDTLEEPQIALATCESVLENGSDAIFAALFWFAVAGVPGVVLYRTANTLDAMWGYRNARYRYFGRVAARLDDLLNWLPARLTALSYALAGWHRKASRSRLRQALRCWREQGGGWKSPNAGPVMAAGAGALGVRLGGPSRYHGTLQPRPVLGAGATPDANAIRRACRLLDRALLIWVVWLALITLLLS